MLDGRTLERRGSSEVTDLSRTGSFRFSDFRGNFSAASLAVLLLLSASFANSNAAAWTIRAKDNQVKKVEPAHETVGVLRQTDKSGKFKYVLPEGWTASKTPFHPNDILVRNGKDRPGTIYLELKPSHGKLEKQVQDATEELEKNLANFKLVSNETISMDSGQKAAKFVCEYTAEASDEKDSQPKVCRVVYIIPQKFRKSLLVSAVVAEPDIEYGTKVASDLIDSIDFGGGKARKK